MTQTEIAPTPVTEMHPVPGPPQGYGYCIGGAALLRCNRCSALVCDAEVHDLFHDQVKRA